MSKLYDSLCGCLKALIIGAGRGLLSSTKPDSANAWTRSLENIKGSVSREDYVKLIGLSCRCIKD